MGLIFRKRIQVGENQTVNLSNGAASVAQRRVTVNSRGRGSIRILPGLSFRFGRRW